MSSTHHSVPTLSASARYFPLTNGKYDVAAGLRPLATDFGNGDLDGKVFQFDQNFPAYRKSKERARAENLDQYYPAHSKLDDSAYRTVVKFIVERLTSEWSDFFRLREEGGRSILECTLTSERLVFDANLSLISATSITGGPLPPYRDLFDALASQVQEDLAIWKRRSGEEEWLAALHLCAPNHWSAEEKIGRPFKQVHGPVADFQKLAAASGPLVDQMIEKGPFVRFAWGVATDDELNHHPKKNSGREFDPSAPLLKLRIERQTLSGFAEVSASLFTIRTYFRDVAVDLSNQERESLSSAIDSMSPEALAYKGLSKTAPAIQEWLRRIYA